MKGLQKGGPGEGFCRKEKANKEESTREHKPVFLLPELPVLACRILSMVCVNQPQTGTTLAQAKVNL
jgi:hypothetical protein